MIMTPFGRNEDRYGRKLRVVVRNGRSLGDWLVSEGLARTWGGPAGSVVLRLRVQQGSFDEMI